MYNTYIYNTDIACKTIQSITKLSNITHTQNVTGYLRKLDMYSLSPTKVLQMAYIWQFLTYRINTKQYLFDLMLHTQTIVYLGTENILSDIFSVQILLLNIFL